jgi:hypothetical protein
VKWRANWAAANRRTDRTTQIADRIKAPAVWCWPYGCNEKLAQEILYGQNPNERADPWVTIGKYLDSMHF